MRMKRTMCVVLACMMFLGTFTFSASAVEITPYLSEEISKSSITPFATNSFNLSITAKTKVRANMSFPLMAGETVTIKASYAPFSASVDFGLVAPDGNFYYFNITNGSIDKTIKVSESGDYTLQIRNNADVDVKVVGFVNY